jgi:NitT/TauT family transport system substrate-binding protein
VEELLKRFIESKQRAIVQAISLLLAGSFFGWTVFLNAPAFAATAAPQPVKIAYASITQFLAGIWGAKEIGAFEKHGLTAELVYISSGGIATAALLGGGLDMALPASNAVVLAALAGAPLIAVASQTDRPGLVLWAQTEITKIADLQGKTLGITRPGSLTHFLTLAALKSNGLEGKVKLQPFGGTPEVATAFNAGMIAGSLSGSRPGPKAHALIRQLGVPFSQGLLVVKKEYYKDSPKTVEAMVRAYVEGVAALRTKKEFGLSVLRKYMRGRPENLVNEDYNSFLEYVITVPRVNPAVIQTVLDWAARSDVPVESFFDNTIVDRMEKEGLFDRLYKDRPTLSR